MLFECKGPDIAPQVVDLAKSAEKIVAREDAEKWGITDVNRFWVAETQ